MLDRPAAADILEEMVLDPHSCQLTYFSTLRVVLAICFSAGILSSWTPSPAAADVVELTNGGEIRGKLESRPLDEAIRVRTIDGITIEIDSSNVSSIRRRPIEAELYVEKARTVADTVEARLELAEWCRSNVLLEQREEQFREVLRIDPNHEYVRKKLGYVWSDGRWRTTDAVKRSEGLIRVGRRWVTRQEAELIEEIALSKERAKKWFPIALQMKAKLRNATPAERQSVLNEIATPGSADVVPAWRETFSDSPDVAIRMAYVVGLSKTNSAATIKPLAAMAVEDIDPGIREAAVDAFPDRHRAAAAKELTRWLTHENNAFVGTAAAALEELGEEIAVPLLIRALVTAHWRNVQVLDNTPGFARAGNDIGYAPQSTLPPEVEAGLRTGQYPFGVQVIPPANRVRTQRVRVEVQNVAVLKALVATTGQNFGYNERAWSAWWRRHQS